MKTRKASERDMKEVGQIHLLLVVVKASYQHSNIQKSLINQEELPEGGCNEVTTFVQALNMSQADYVIVCLCPPQA